MPTGQPPMPSSVIRHYRYNEERHELLVCFVNGRRYIYLQVPRATVTAFSAADSKGSYFNAHIRDHFPYRELDGVTR